MARYRRYGRKRYGRRGFVKRKGRRRRTRRLGSYITRGGFRF